MSHYLGPRQGDCRFIVKLNEAQVQIPNSKLLKLMSLILMNKLTKFLQREDHQNVNEQERKQNFFSLDIFS